MVGRRFDRQVRYGRILGLLFAVAGFVAIGLGWNGAAKNAFFDKQFPYLISGGLGGLALVVFGIGLLLVAQVRAERAKLADQLEHLASTIGKAASAGPAGSAANGRVVAGRSTYHRPDCRLVQGKSDLDFLSVEAARGSGLSPCRVCNPERGDEEPSERPQRSRGGRRR
ncbi:MAG TPA: hypothetical protein VHL78_02425 [Actinomycetota bacterium]|nr:hypothetical protein [Actinomycetota bacterium]